MEECGAVNQSFIPESKSSTALVSPCTESNVKIEKRMASIDSGIGCTDNDLTVDISEEALNDDCSSAASSDDLPIEYSNGRFNTYTAPMTQKKIDTSPEYEDLKMYSDKAVYKNSKISERIYTLPTNLPVPDKLTSNNASSGKVGRFQRIYSLPENQTLQQQQHHVESNTAIMIQNGEYTIPSGGEGGQKKRNVLYEKTKVIKTNSLTYSTPSGENKLSNATASTRRRNTRNNRLFCVLNIIFGCIAVVALILGIIVLVNQKRIARTEEKSNEKLNILSSAKDSFDGAVNSLTTATNKISKISGNMGHVNNTLQKIVSKIHILYKQLNKTSAP